MTSRMQSEPAPPITKQLTDAITIYNLLVHFTQWSRKGYSASHKALHESVVILRGLEEHRLQLPLGDCTNLKQMFENERRKAVGHMICERDRWTVLLGEVKEAKEKMVQLERTVAAERRQAAEAEKVAQEREEEGAEITAAD